MYSNKYRYGSSNYMQWYGWCHRALWLSDRHVVASEWGGVHAPVVARVVVFCSLPPCNARLAEVSLAWHWGGVYSAGAQLARMERGGRETHLSAPPVVLLAVPPSILPPECEPGEHALNMMERGGGGLFRPRFLSVLSTYCDRPHSLEPAPTAKSVGKVLGDGGKSQGADVITSTWGS